MKNKLLLINEEKMSKMVARLAHEILESTSNYENIVFALSIGKYFGVSEENAAKEIAQFLQIIIDLN